GSSGNQFTCSNGQWTNLWYDADIHSILFAHRSNDQAGWPTTGFVACDYSTDNGATWSADQGPIYADSLNTFRARFPQAVIYNPAGNTSPSNAYFSTFGIAHDGTGYAGYFEGTVPVNLSYPEQNALPFITNGFNTLMPQSGLIVKNTGTQWWSAEGFDGTGYNDSIIISKGIFNSALQQFSYTFQKVNIPVKTTNTGKKIFYNQAITFNDEGNIGYLAVLGNDWVNTNTFKDSAMGIIIYASTDSGYTWNRLTGISLNDLDPQLLNNGSSYQAGYTLDIGVDKNNNLHVVLPVLPHAIGNEISYWLNQPVSRSWGIFDISTNNGLAWNGCLVAYPETYYGAFGNMQFVYEDNRAQFSRSWDGSKLFFTWFDTDTLLYGPGLNNFPDMHAVGYDVDQNLWTNEFNFTEGTGLQADGMCYFGNISYYTINDGVNENIPMVYDSLDFTSVNNPVYFSYLGGAAVSGYANPGQCIQLINAVAENNFKSLTFSVSSPYPNPFSNKSCVDVTIPNSSDLKVEITNFLGQILSSTVNKNQPAGKITLTFDGTELSPGLYFYSVKSGNESATKMMCVE
ncbi:MAG: T9SS type A sorting domain-containing protein, partial [Bacteroidota bacterium]